VISSYGYTLDAVGNRTKIVEGGGRIVDYVYDDLYRLVSETIADSGMVESFTYTYDNVGNRLSKVECMDLDCETTSYTYNLNNQLLTETAGTDVTQYFYDTNGNTIEKSTGALITSYYYDHQNRLVEAFTPNNSVELAYDADGARVSKAVDGTTVNYLLDKNRRYHQVLEERTEIGDVLALYTYGNQRISMIRDGVDAFYLFDGLGSVTALTNNVGQVTDQYTYEAFGKLLGSSGSTENPYYYTGEHWDFEIGMQYLRARYMDPAVGRFMTMDAHPGNAQHPITLNKYLYGNSNPVMYIDPSGEFGIVGAMVTVGVIGVLSAVAIATSGCSSCSLNTGSGERNTLLAVYADYPIYGGANGVLGENALAKNMTNSFRKHWIVKDVAQGEGTTVDSISVGVNIVFA
jgi:RHS repeat-associated protein